MLDEGRDVLALLLDDPAALAPDAPASDVEDLHRGLEVVVGQGEDVGVRRVTEDHGLLLEGLGEGADVVTQPSGLFEVELGGRLLHAGLESLGEAGRVAGHEVAEVLGDRPVLVRGDAPDTGGGTLVDVAEQARATAGRRTLEDTGGAGAHREDAEQQVERLADRPRMAVGAEVARALALGAPHDLGPWELIAHRHGEEGVGLVVAVLDVEARVELLDPGVLELEGLDLRAHHGPLDGGRGGDHGGGARVQRRDVLEVRGEPRTQRLRLADVDDPAVRVAEAVDPRVGGDLPRLRSVGRRIRHGVHPMSGPRHRRTARAGAHRRSQTPPERLAETALRGRVQLTVKVFPLTVIVFGVSPVGAGPDTRSPVAASKWLWWHGQMIW